MDEAIPVSQVLECWGSLGQLGPNTPNHVQGYMKSNSKSSDPYFISDETCGSSYTCFTVTQVLGEFGETWPEYPNHAQGHMKSSP